MQVEGHELLPGDEVTLLYRRLPVTEKILGVRVARLWVQLVLESGRKPQLPTKMKFNITRSGHGEEPDVREVPEAVMPEVRRRAASLSRRDPGTGRAADVHRLRGYGHRDGLGRQHSEDGVTSGV